MCGGLTTLKFPVGASAQDAGHGHRVATQFSMGGTEANTAVRSSLEAKARTPPPSFQWAVLANTGGNGFEG